jgi:hypothetical protein
VCEISSEKEKSVMWWEEWEGSGWWGGNESGQKGKWIRREGCETGRCGKSQGRKSDDAGKLAVPSGKVPKFEDCERKGGLKVRKHERDHIGMGTDPNGSHGRCLPPPPTGSGKMGWYAGRGKPITRDG